MSTTDLAHEAVAGLFARPGRMVLTVLGTVIGLAALVATLGLSRTAGNRIVGRFDELAATEIMISARPARSDGLSNHPPWDAPGRLERLRFGALGLLLLTQFETVLSMALYAYSVVGATLTPVLIAAFLWRRVTPQGGVACIASGLAIILGLAVLDRLGVDFVVTFGGIDFDFASSDYIVIPGVLVSVSMLILVSLFTPASPPETWAPFFDKEPPEPSASPA